MVGDKLRQARVARQMSLADVAGEAHVSAATLSRVERDKQAIDVELFLTLARVLNAAPADLLTDEAAGTADAVLVTRIAAMQARERTKLWREINAERTQQRQRKRADAHNMALEVEELLAQMDLLRDEIDSVRMRLAKKSSRLRREEGAVREQRDLVPRLPPIRSAARGQRAVDEVKVRLRAVVVVREIEARIDDVEPGRAAPGNAADGEARHERDGADVDGRKAAGVRELVLRAVVRRAGAAVARERERAPDVAAAEAEVCVGVEAVGLLVAVQTVGDEVDTGVFDGGVDLLPRPGEAIPQHDRRRQGDVARELQALLRCGRRCGG